MQKGFAARQPLVNKTSYVDLMNPEAVRAFLNCTHEQYKKACGKYFGKEIPGIFTDEPCCLMQNHYDVPLSHGRTGSLLFSKSAADIK